MLDPLHTSIALGPLAVYLFLLGVINVSRRPFLTTGTRDLYALGIGISGFAMIGPIDLFMPEAAAQFFGPYIWLMLLAFYSLCLTLMVLLIRPRLVIYNITLEQLRPLLANMLQRLQMEHQWAGESLAIPALGVQLQLERFDLLRNVALVATAADQSYAGWRRLEHELSIELQSQETRPNPLGFVMLAVGIIVAGASLLWMVVEHEEVVQGLMEMLRL